MPMHLLPDCLEGAVDLHVHSSPDVDPRRFDDIDLAREAARVGMAGLLIKSHQNSTVERAWLAAKVVPEIRVFGGLVLNETVGGFNPAAVRLAVKLGARQVWMPTRSAANHRRHHGQEGGLTVFDGGGLRKEVLEILDAMAGGEAILGTGHLSPEESCALIAEARRRGVERILVTHPEWGATYYSVEMQRRLRQQHGVSFERCFVSTTHRCGNVPMAVIEEAIAAVGVDSTVISTDLGQPDTPPPAEGLRMYAERLRAGGFSPDDLRAMMATNPARLLGL